MGTTRWRNERFRGSEGTTERVLGAVIYAALRKVHTLPSFLIWYLENYYRLDAQEAVDSVCDNRGDKGTDGIFVNDDNQTITVFQSRIAQSNNTAIGDKSLRELAGTMKQYESVEALQAMIASAGKAEVASLAKRLDLVNKVGTYELRGEFLSNVDVDKNGSDYLKGGNISFVGRTRLVSTYISTEREIPQHKAASFDIVGLPFAEYKATGDNKTVIVPVKAKELVALEGIADQSLFAPNVRGPLGSTRVNKAIVTSIREKNLHKLFPLFHNGITVIAGTLTVNKDSVVVEDYYIVNGCQSLTALFENKGYLTDDLRILTKFIKADRSSDVAKKVTHYSNNQNGVKARDFVANSSTQVRLQNEVEMHYKGQYVLEIKRGEKHGAGTVIANEEAGLLLMAFDLQEPWATHRRYQVFQDKHADVFGRPEVTADRIVLCQVISEASAEASKGLTNVAFQKYLLTRYLLMYIARQILDHDPIGPEVLQSPATFVRSKDSRDKFRKCMKAVFDEVVIDINYEVDGLGNDFDYRDKLRDTAWVKQLSGNVVKDHLKQVSKGRIESLKNEWATANKAKGA